MSPEPRSPAELLAALGIVDPADIDVAAIAQHCGATVVVEPLSGCEARVLGYGDRAVITVDAASSSTRQRFSAAHELGHWLADRGRVAHHLCAERELAAVGPGTSPEQRANRFAAELLLPAAMVRAHLRGAPVGLETAHSLADRFRTSLSAAAVRLVELAPTPALLLCFAPGRSRWKWHFRSTAVAKGLWPRSLPAAGSAAAALLANASAAGGTSELPGSVWFRRPEAHLLRVREESAAFSGYVLSVLSWATGPHLPGSTAA